MKKAIRSLLAITTVFALAASPSLADPPAKRVARLDATHKGVSNPAKGASGRAVLKIHRGHTRLCYRITFEGMTTFHADIRRLKTERVVRELYHGQPTDDTITGCKKKMSRRILKKLRTHPRRFFVYVSEYQSLGQPPREIAGTLKR